MATSEEVSAEQQVAASQEEQEKLKTALMELSTSGRCLRKQTTQILHLSVSSNSSMIDCVDRCCLEEGKGIVLHEDKQYYPSHQEGLHAAAFGVDSLRCARTLKNGLSSLVQPCTSFSYFCCYVVYPEAEIIVGDEDTQPLETPIVQPIKQKKFEHVEPEIPETSFDFKYVSCETYAACWRWCMQACRRD